jgi:hypothetical protein
MRVDQGVVACRKALCIVEAVAESSIRPVTLKLGPRLVCA